MRIDIALSALPKGHHPIEIAQEEQTLKNKIGQLLADEGYEKIVVADGPYPSEKEKEKEKEKFKIELWLVELASSLESEALMQPPDVAGVYEQRAKEIRAFLETF